MERLPLVLFEFSFLFSAINTSGPRKVVGPWGNTQAAPSPLRWLLEDSGIFPRWRMSGWVSVSVGQGVVHGHSLTGLDQRVIS